MSELPDELKPLFTGEPVLQVLGAGAPWLYPQGWLAERRERMTDLIEDPRFDRVAFTRPDWLKTNAPYLAVAFNDVIWSLYPPLALLVGAGRNLHRQLLHRYTAEPPTFTKDSTAWSFSYAGAHLPLQAFDLLAKLPDAREALVGFCGSALDLLEGVAPYESRRTALAAIWRDIADDEALLEAHRTAPRDELIALWRDRFLSKDDLYDVFPEQTGNPLDLLTVAMARFETAHRTVAEITPELDRSLVETIASLIHQVGRAELPGGLAVSGLNRDGTADVQREFDRQAADVDRGAWRVRRVAWLARTVDAGGAREAGEWIAAMNLLGGVLNGLPDRAKRSADLGIVTGYLTTLRDVYRVRRRQRPINLEPATERPEPETDRPERTTDEGKPATVAGPGAATGIDPEKELAELIGLAGVKERVAELIAEASVAGIRAAAGMKQAMPLRHLVFTGNPGTGKTTVARLLGAIYRKYGALSSGQRVEVGRADLVGEYTGKTAPMVEAVIDRARGGVLFVDEAYSLVNRANDKDLGFEALATLVSAMENHRDDLVVVLAGYPSQMETLMDSNPGLRSRIGATINFPDYSDDEMLQIFRLLADQSGFEVADEVVDRVTLALRRLPRAPGFGNARAVRSLLDQMSTRQAVRVARLTDPSPEEVRALLVEDLPPLPGSALAAGGEVDAETQLEQLVGLAEAKTVAGQLAAEATADVLRIKAGMRPTERSRHMVFLGNPGTGKTTVARILAGVYRDLGLLGSGQLIEASRADLIAGYLGQTAPKVRKVVERALGGVLFIDEAYSLFDRFSYGAEAIATLLQEMEEHRDDLVVVLAGYEREMQVLLDSNSGLRSRFPTVMTFPDYTRSELETIYAGLADEAGFTLEHGMLSRVSGLIEPFRGTTNFGNARLARTAFELTCLQQATRILALTDPTSDQIRSLVLADLPKRLPGDTEDASPYL